MVGPPAIPPATVIPSIDNTGFAQRLVRLFPPDWTGDTAKSSGGGLYALMFGLGNQFAFLDTAIIYAWHTTRIATATDSALDAVSQDFFGSTLPRLSGEGDTSFRARIQANLFLPAATRPALISMLTRLTGSQPRVMEPWSPVDTGCWNFTSYWDVDIYKSAPFRWGDPGLRYQGFVETPLAPLNSALASTMPVWCYDAGFSWDTPVSNWFDPQSSWFINVANMDAAINANKPAGTIVWRKYLSQPLINYAIGGTISVPSNSVSISLSVLPFAGPYVVFVQPSWNTTAYIDSISENGFILKFGTSAPPGATIDYATAPISLPGVGSVPVPQNQNSVNVGVPMGMSGFVPVISPSWDTTAWVSSFTSTLITISFQTRPQFSAFLDYMYVPPSRSGIYGVAGGQAVANVPISGTVSGPFEAFLAPDWNTTVEVMVKTPTMLTVRFGTPAPAAQNLYWAIQNG